MDSATRRKLSQIIEDAFANTPYPENGFIGGELEELEGHHWKDIPIEVIKKHRDDLMNFSSGGFRFFIPAFLIAVILHSDEVDTLRDNIIYVLAPPTLGDGPSHLVLVKEKILSNRVGILAPQEKAAIRSFLEAYKDLEPYAAWTDMPSSRERLQRALEFWKEQ